MRTIRLTGLCRVVIIATLLCTALVATGCSVGYLLHAASGQLRLIWNAVPIQEAWDDPALTGPRMDRLLMIARIKAFGEDRLGLRRTGSYSTVNTRFSRGTIYTVSAAPKDRLEPFTWWFPVVGDMPYLGFFDLNRAREEAQRLSEKGLDVFLGRSVAYSTLGWFKDPVTLNLLDMQPDELADTILHELTHATLYVKGMGEFNESFAVLVGRVGALRFMEETFGHDHPWTARARDALHDERLFSRFLGLLLHRLENLYARPLPPEVKLSEREAIFRKALKDFSHLKTRLRTPAFHYFENLPLNNATLLAVGLYHRRFSLLDAVLEAHDGDLRKTIGFFVGLCKREKDPLGAAKKWLEQLPAPVGKGLFHPSPAGWGKVPSARNF
ncbi:MAG: aminopeptidase [Deltaproteobacteria bacterium]|nr:aminopeptidase [Deltaproteobacteria bacterium]MBW1950503.1 aminopeptidase [Deltaproteobacteria bacterium]